MSDGLGVGGWVAPGFEPVLETFRDLVASGAEHGGAFAAHVHGQVVVDVWGGWADVARQHPWVSETMVAPFSVAKPFAALTVLTAAHDGLLRLDDPIATFWPDYGAAGKGATTVRMLLGHRAGQPSFPTDARGIDPLDADSLRASLAAAPPELEPGVEVAEHALTYGHLIEGLLDAVSGESIEDRFAPIAAELELDATFSVGASRAARVAEIEYSTPTWLSDYLATATPLAGRALTIPTGALEPSLLNSARWRAAPYAAIGLHTTARAVAAFYAGLTASGGPVARMLGPALHAAYVSGELVGDDGFTGRPTGWTLGFQRDADEISMGGLGGSAGWHTPATGVSAAYVTRWLADWDRVDAMEAAVNRCL